MERGEEAREQSAWEGDLIQVTNFLFSAYQEALAAARALDFPDLIYYTYRLLRDNVALGEECRHRFAYILVDEFQDTNRAQFALLRLLARDEKMSNVTVVGDERQAIYGWRNADKCEGICGPGSGGEEIRLHTECRSYGKTGICSQFNMENPHLLQDNSL